MNISDVIAKLKLSDEDYKIYSSHSKIDKDSGVKIDTRDLDPIIRVPKEYPLLVYGVTSEPMTSGALIKKLHKFDGENDLELGYDDGYSKKRVSKVVISEEDKIVVFCL